MANCRSLLIAVALVCGCGTATEPASSDKSNQDPPPSPDERDSGGPQPVDTKPHEPIEPPTEPYAPNPQGYGDECTDNAGCGWDDPCVATRCVGAAHVRVDDHECEERAPPPGECGCIAGHCSLKPTVVATEAPSCKLESCGLDQGAGRCVAGSMVEANRMMRDVGPACHCDQKSLECQFVWVEPIECKDVEACWVSDSRPYHPIARPKEKRGKKFQPCKDGEVAPVCIDGRCSLAAYSC
jgi:hypothetical protein